MPKVKRHKRLPTLQEIIDIASEDSFPASDPPARTVIKSVGPPPADLGESDNDNTRKAR